MCQYFADSRWSGNSLFESCERRECFMTSFEELYIILTMLMLITAILALTKK